MYKMEQITQPPTYAYYQLRYDSHAIGILHEALNFLNLQPYHYVAGKEYKLDSTPHYQCLLILEKTLDQNDKVKLRTKLKRLLKDQDISHKNSVAVTTAKSPFDLMNYCKKEGNYLDTLTDHIKEQIILLPRKQSDKEWKQKRHEMIKSNKQLYSISPIKDFYGAVIKFHIDNHKVPPSRSYLRFLALQWRFITIEHYLQLIGLNDD